MSPDNIVRFLIFALVSLSLSCSATAQEQKNKSAVDKRMLSDLATKYEDLQNELEIKIEELGPEHPSVQETRSSLDKVAFFIREAKVGIGEINDEVALKKVKLKAKELSAAIGKLKPLYGNERDLDSAMAELKKALSKLEAKRNYQEIIDLSIASETLVELDRNFTLDREKVYQDQLLLRAKELEAMNKQLVKAQRAQEAKAQKEMQQALEFIRNSQIEQNSDRSKSSVGETEAMAFRLKKLESDVSEIKVMLKKILDK